jgi:hypothetical protein
MHFCDLRGFLAGGMGVTDYQDVTFSFPSSGGDASEIQRQRPFWRSRATVPQRRTRQAAGAAEVLVGGGSRATGSEVQ